MQKRTGESGSLFSCEDIVGSCKNGKTVNKPPFYSAVSCGVRKDSGDDPDITNGALICATAALSDRPGIRIDGGEGVGRVTKPGLDQPVGSAAINSTPRRMIEMAVREAMEAAAACGEYGLEVTISVPRGLELAAQTFNLVFEVVLHHVDHLLAFLVVAKLLILTAQDMAHGIQFFLGKKFGNTYLKSPIDSDSKAVRQCPDREDIFCEPS